MKTDHEQARRDAAAFDREQARLQKMADDIVDEYNAKRLLTEQERTLSFPNQLIGA